MENIKKYDLHKYGYSKLHFEVNHALPYFEKHQAKASKAHRHSFFQVIWMKSAGRHYIDYEVIEHPENTIFFINQDQVHHFCKDSLNEGYLYHFNDIFISKNGSELLDRFCISIFNEINACHLALPDRKAVETFESLTQFMLTEQMSQDEPYKDLIYHHFVSLLLYLERLVEQAYGGNKQGNADYSIAATFKQLITARLNQPTSIDEYAETLGITSKKLTEVSKQILSDTPAKIIAQRKVLEAKRMLSNPKMSIKEVGYALGFEQATYFTKYFKKAVGLTPKEFQQHIR